MKSTKALRSRLRKMINDLIIDDDDSKADFSNEELDLIIEESTSIYKAAAEVWTIKASMLQGDIESYSSGNERYDLSSLKDRLDHALKMVDIYSGKETNVEEEMQGSIMFKFKSPDVL